MAWSGSAVAACDAAEAGIRDAVGQGAGIVCLQELFASPYFCQEEDIACFDLAEPVPGPTTERFADLARELEVVIVVPIFERRTAGLYHNTAAVIDATGDLLGTYRKMHIPDDPQFFEKFYFTPGDLGTRLRDALCAGGVLICWDQWYPEAARLMALGGAELICYPTAIAWPAAGGGRTARRSAMPWRDGDSGGMRSQTACGWRRSTVSASRHPRQAAFGSGADRSSAIRSGGSSRRRRTRRRWSSHGANAGWWSSNAARGRSFATGGSIPTRGCANDSSTAVDECVAGRRPDAGGMGAARRHLARLAAQPRRLAGEDRRGRVVLRRHDPPPGTGRACRARLSGARVRRRAFDRLARSGVDTARVDTHLVPTNRSWIRDSGPIFVVRDHGARERS